MSRGTSVLREEPGIPLIPCPGIWPPGILGAQPAHWAKGFWWWWVVWGLSALTSMEAGGLGDGTHGPGLRDSIPAGEEAPPLGAGLRGNRMPIG